MDSKPKIVVVGSCMVDYVWYAHQLPKQGETVRGSKLVNNFGGKGANQCVAAAKLGANTKLVAKVGDDDWGEKYIRNLHEQNVDTEHVKKANFITGLAQITVDSSGANQIVIIPGSNDLLQPEDMEKIEDIKNAAVLVCQLETPVATVLKAMELCNGTTILNAAPAISTEKSNLFSVPTIFCVNESEAETFTGLTVQTKEEAKAAITALLGKGCKSVIITLGKKGAVYGRAGDNPEDYFSCKSPVVSCVDSTGAGDAFIGALAYLLAYKSDKFSFYKCLEVACCVAADSVTRLGTQISFAGRDIVDGYIDGDFKKQ